ncbi:MAG: molecular chaperone DnaJ [Candidatus Micrarchaeota archaeon]
MAGKDYYATLGVARDVTAAQIKDAYRRLAMQWHPDRNKSKDAEEKFKGISEAYAVLSDEGKRRQYDEYGSEGFGRRFTQEDIFRGADFSDISDLFERVVNEGSPFGSFFESGFGARRERRGEDTYTQIELTLEEAANGTAKNVQVKRYAPCQACNGTGAKDGKRVECKVCSGQGAVYHIQRIGPFAVRQPVACKTCRGSGRMPTNPCRTCSGSGRVKTSETVQTGIPAGIFDGASISIEGKGNASTVPGERPGNLIAAIVVKPHRHFRRDGRDIYYDAHVSFPLAALGGEIEVPTLEAKARFEVPEGTRNGTSFRLHGKGMPDLDTGRVGDLIVRIDVDVPTKLSKRQKEILEEFELETKEAKKEGFFRRIFR